MTLNLDAVFFLTQEVARRCFIPRRAGKVVNVASVAGLSGNPPEMTTVAYNTSKGAVVNLTRTLAAEWGQHGINVNAICPGFFPSRMSKGILDQIEQAVIARTPLRRIGGDEDLKGAAVFLASEASRHLTGQYLAVDGGACIA
jgi:gluconate 5-dehydrogenase